MKKFLINFPIIGKIINIIYRIPIGIFYFKTPLKSFFIWLFKSNETTNFTYPLDPINFDYLISFISTATKKNFNDIKKYITEIEADENLRNHILKVSAENEESFKSDQAVNFGRRIGWYALIRAIKPKVVIETGVDKGMGSCVITSALKRNSEEGFAGRYFGTDINPKAGYLLTPPYSNYGEILYGDSIESLKNLGDIKIDLFINDSDHSADYEAEEYKTVNDKLNNNAYIIGDNSHCTDKLLKFALETDRIFMFYQEKPDRHWYPGAGIGLAFHKN